MNVTVLGATGGLGRNVVDEALARGHSVRALVRDPSRAKLPPQVAIVKGDATDPERMKEACATEAVFFCVNPPLSDWARAFPPLLETAIATVRATSARLVFPGNVWIYGKVPTGVRVDESRVATPTSVRGKMRAAMEARLFSSGVEAHLVRLPEFYGPSVVTLSALIIRGVLERKTVLWPGPLERELEWVFMPDAAKALVAVAELGSAAPAKLHQPGSRCSPRAFAEQVEKATGKRARLLSVPAWGLAVAGLFDSTARAVLDIRHLLTDPVLLDGSLMTKTLGAVPLTPFSEALERTISWNRDHPTLRLQG